MCVMLLTNNTQLDHERYVIRRFNDVYSLKIIARVLDTILVYGKGKLLQVMTPSQFYPASGHLIVLAVHINYCEFGEF